MKTLEEVLSEFLEYAKSIKPDGNWAPHSPLSDLVIATPANIAWKLWVIAEYVRNIQTFQGLNYIINNQTLISDLATALGRTNDEIKTLIYRDINNLAYDWGFTRKGAQYAYGTVRVYFEAHGTYSIPQGTQFSASGGLIFESIHDATNWTTQELDGQPAFDIVVKCTIPGSIGNIAPRRINTLVTRIDGVVGISNPYAMSGGADEETNEDFLNRILSALNSVSTGSTAWLSNLIFQLDAVRQVKVVTCRENNLNDYQRPYGVDVWVNAIEEPVLATDPVSSFETYHIALQQPVIESLTYQFISPNITFQRSYPRNNITGEENIFALSVFGNDSFHSITPLPSSIQYYYDRTIEAIQALISNENYWFLGGESNVIIRKAIPRRVNILNCDIWLNKGYNPNEVESDILYDLVAFFTGGTTKAGRKYSLPQIGSSIDHSDILEVILEVEGVDRITIETFAVELGATAYSEPITSDPLELMFFEYPTLGTTNFVFHL